MSSRQHAPLILIDGDGSSRRLPPISMQARAASGGYDEAWIRDLVFAHPEAIPVQEIDPSFGPLVPICVELDTRAAGFADALFLNNLGMPTIVECKLWRNPEARREVVGQILDYARALRRWTYAELSREVARARQQQAFDLIAHMRENGHPDLDEAAFVDNVTRHLAKGRMLLLVLGDGIREGVEAIGAYLQEETGLHFSFGLVEAQVYALEDGRRLLQPRVLVRTVNIVRNLVNTGPFVSVVEDEPAGNEQDAEVAPPDEREQWMLGFWTELLSTLKLDDKNQKLANPISQSNIFFPLPKIPLWFTGYFISAKNAAGVFLAYTKTAPSAVEVIARLVSERDEIDANFAKVGLEITWNRHGDKLYIGASKYFPAIRDDQYRAEELAWFSRTINAFVNVLRPRIIDHWNELTNGGGQP